MPFKALFFLDLTPTFAQDLIWSVTEMNPKDMIMHPRTGNACLNAGRGRDDVDTLWSFTEASINWNKNRRNGCTYVDTLEGTNSDGDGWMWTAPPSMPLVSSKQTDGSAFIYSQCAPLWFEIRLSPWDWDGRETSSPSLILSMHTPYCRSKASLKHTLWWWWTLTLGSFMIIWARNNSSEVHTYTGWSSRIPSVLTAVFLCNCVQPRVCQCASLSWNPSEERLAWYDPNLPPGGQTTTWEEEEEVDCFTKQLKILLAVFLRVQRWSDMFILSAPCEQTKLGHNSFRFASITLNSLQKPLKLQDLFFMPDFKALKSAVVDDWVGTCLCQ